MSLKEALQDAKEDSPYGVRCSVGLLLASLPDADRATLLDWLTDPDNPSSVIHRGLTKAGHSVGYEAINRHRRSVCRCK